MPLSDFQSILVAIETRRRSNAAARGRSHGPSRGGHGRASSQLSPLAGNAAPFRTVRWQCLDFGTVLFFVCGRLSLRLTTTPSPRALL